MRRVPAVARLVLGAVLLAIGLNGFLDLVTLPALSERGGAFLGALDETGYLLTLVLTVEVVVGALLVANRFVPLALVVLAPVAVNIALYHVFLDRGLPGIVVGLLVFVLDVLLIGAYRGYYAPMTRARSAPTDGPGSI
ncbi:MAG TPA: hypothetical protein VF576_04830 [Rubricoccaceae bacterium]|jgi:uncharacterized membrane protein YphA (DoxX/SURF4 family)